MASTCQFLLDTELQDNNIKFIAAKLKESPYSIEQVKQINKDEVFPVRYWNLLSTANVWTGSQGAMAYHQQVEKNNANKAFFNRIVYSRLKRMFTDQWNKLEVEYRR